MKDDTHLVCFPLFLFLKSVISVPQASKMVDEERVQISCSENARFPQLLIVCLTFVASIDFPMIFQGAEGR